MKLESKFGLGEIVIREVHQNGKMLQDRLMEVVAICVERVSSGDIVFAYVCEDASNGHRQHYSESMLVGDPLYDQDSGKYPIEITDDTNRV